METLKKLHIQQYIADIENMEGRHMAFCIKCGAAMEDDSRFCMMCGTPRETQPVAEQPVMTPVVEQPVVNPVVVEQVEQPAEQEPAGKVAVSLSKEPQADFAETQSVEVSQPDFASVQPEVPQTGFESVQPEVPQTGFTPVQPEVPQTGFTPVQPEAPQTGFTPVQPEVPQTGFVSVQPEAQQAGFVPVQSAPQQAYDTQPAYQQTYSAVPNGPRKTKKGPIIAVLSVGFVAIAAIIVAIVMLLNKGPAEIDLSNYVEIEYDGYDTTGTAYVYINDTKLLVDILKAQGEDTNTSKVSFSMKALMNSIEVEQNTYEGLSNGEKISITVKFDQLLMEENDIEFKNATKEYTVEDLVELIEVDPFENITIRFSGTSPEGYAYYDNSSDISCVRWAEMEFDKDDELANGDTVTLRVTQKAIDNAVSNGYRFTVTSKDYKVEGLSYYYTSIDEISDEHMEKYKAEADSAFDDAMSWASYVEVSDKELLGTYFAKSTVYPSNNMIIFVYTATVTSTEGYFDPTTIYVPVSMRVSCVEKGELGNIWGYTDGFMTTEVGYGSCTGYISGDLMYTNYILNNVSKNDYEVIATKGMPEFKETTAENVLPAPGQSGAATDANTETSTADTENATEEQTTVAPEN